MMWLCAGVLSWALLLGGSFMMFLSGIGCADAGAACTDMNGWGILLLPGAPFVGPVVGGAVWLGWWLIGGRGWSLRWHRRLAGLVLAGILTVALASRVMAGRYAVLN